MRNVAPKAMLTAGLWLTGAMLGSCGPEISDKARRQSDRFYEAAHIAWYDEHDNLAAIRHLTRAVEKNPDNDDAHYLLGTLRLGRGELDRAEHHLREAVRLRGENRPAARCEALNSLGVLLIHQQRYAEAIRFLEEAADEVLNREPWLAMGNLGWAYIELGEHEKAIEVLRRAIFDQSRFCVGKYRLGQAYYLSGDYRAAEQSLTDAIGSEDERCGEIQQAHRLLGMTHLRLGDDERAREAFDRCEQIDPGSEIGRQCTDALSDL
jgi:type IV pilus assembly protein PilF